ncbi:MAG: GIY-YIG nuclease family protein [Geminocystis sp.]|nr:GIY-YIG nuclease family protein [Geminocystis sp.]MDW8462529.1 GIY-YIG nuclease family protein [Geminocystis sp.]
MYADGEILGLPRVELKQRDLLPPRPGIYYVVDGEKVVWYIGKAKNLKKRWQGKSHHRIYQLMTQKKKEFIIYYQLVGEGDLDEWERKAIAKYNPTLNDGEAKRKRIRPSESLLRETIISLGDYLVVIGRESPRIHDKELLTWCENWGERWWVLNKIVGLEVVHIGVDWYELLKFAGGEEVALGILNSIFKSRRGYAHKWEGFTPKNPYIPLCGAARLLVNGYGVEVSIINFQEFETYRDRLTSEWVRVMTPEWVRRLNNFGVRNPFGFFLTDGGEGESRKKIARRLAMRIQPYSGNCIPSVFQEELEEENLRGKMIRIKREYQEGKRGFGSRSGD